MSKKLTSVLITDIRSRMGKLLRRLQKNAFSLSFGGKHWPVKRIDGRHRKIVAARAGWCATLAPWT
ncbi:MAG TPA: hypothetical protein VFM24_08080, partial [Nitrospira sp.]|nr:hypothetical protein [Nitrospira sp.]